MNCLSARQVWRQLTPFTGIINYYFKMPNRILRIIISLALHMTWWTALSWRKSSSWVCWKTVKQREKLMLLLLKLLVLMRIPSSFHLIFHAFKPFKSASDDSLQTMKWMLFILSYFMYFLIKATWMKLKFYFLTYFPPST